MRAEPPADGPRDGALAEAFLEMLAAERGASLNTLVAYRRDLEDFRAVTGCLAVATTPDVQRYLSGLAGRGFASTSQILFRADCSSAKTAVAPSRKVTTPEVIAQMLFPKPVEASITCRTAWAP